jgi:hypothetical protein
MNKKEGFITGICIAIYGVAMFILGLIGGKAKAEADILDGVIKRDDELEKELKEVRPFDPEKVTKEEALEIYKTLSEEEQEKFRKKLDKAHTICERQNELLAFGEKI